MKKIDWKKIKLTKEEQEIEDHIDEYVPLPPSERKRMEQALQKARKEKTISLRLTNQTLWKIKQRAAQEGLPYQTLIGSIIHKYMTHQLVDEKHVRKVAASLRQR